MMYDPLPPLDNKAAYVKPARCVCVCLSVCLSVCVCVCARARVIVV